VGTGPAIAIDGSQLAIEPNGTLLVIDHLGNNVLQIDPATGNRTILSGITEGTGPLWLIDGLGTACAIVPNVPEPSALILAALGGLALLAYRRWQARRA
jgi:hypothetical protein